MAQQWASLQSGDAFLHAAESLAEWQRTSVDDVLHQFTAAANSVLNRFDLQQSPGLTAGEIDVLFRSGGVSAEQLLEAEAALRHGGWTKALLRTAMADTMTSLSAAQAASALKLSPSAIRHRLLKHSLWSFTIGGEHRLPMWQFVERADEDGRLTPLPGLRQLLEAIPEDATASEVNAFMTTPQPALEIDDQPVTVAQWLLSGGDPATVTTLVEGMTTAW